MHSFSAFARRAAVAALALTAACGGDSKKSVTGPDEVPTNSSFSASISGAMSRSVSGFAGFATDQEEGGWVVSMASSNQQTGDVIGFFREARGVPGASTYQLGDGCGNGNQSAQTIVGVLIANGGSELFMGRSGTLNLTSSSNSRVKGTFTINASAVNASANGCSARQITITGNFDAPRVNGTAQLSSATITALHVAR